ncbi:hypothetical protein LN042_11450 [Kitasatospora sp. RB6PN24]|uniref:hypothetical protein n=1 Tax=Kitasatospora humi TaxID=2893891 RepID=UPI001E4BD33A|nr:hypothetical protein [Kitasatospora humi]MCC9307704.1 hypothetical protein [Kitasatospora humi]
MAHATWHAAITAADIQLITTDDYERLHAAIPGAATRHDADTGRLTISWRLDAATLTQATDNALKTARTALRDVLGATADLVDIRVRTADDHEREARQPAPMELWGYKETAEALKVSRQRVAELEKTRPDFPQPIARTAAGPVFTAESIRQFDAGWVRARTGRPRKTEA